MALARFFNPRHFDLNVPRITNVAFKHSRPDPDAGEIDTPDGKMGISVVDTECACGKGSPKDCMCSHIRDYYSGPFPDPVVYWTFEPELLEPGEEDDPKWTVSIVATASDTDDECHRNIHGITDGRGYNTILKKRARFEQMTICVDGAPEPFSWDRIREVMPA